MGVTRFPNGVSSWGMPVLPSGGADVYTGSTFFVDSGHAKSDDDAYNGEKDRPFATLDYAIGKCTASAGDRIIVAEGHTETLTATTALDVAGVTIIGCGSGDLRPTFTVNATIPGLNITGANTTVSNLRVIAGSSVATTSRLLRVAASQVKVIGCQFEIAYKVFHTAVIVSGDDVQILNSTFLNTYAPGAGAAGSKAQCAVLNILGTNVLVKGCRFNDTTADKAQRWKACVESGGATSSTSVEDCTFVCRGIATRTRTSNGASGLMSTLYCRAISPSSNTAAGALFTPTYQYIIESYNVAAVNKVGVVSVTTASDRNLKTDICYLDEYRMAA